MVSCLCVLLLFLLFSVIRADPCTSYTLLSGQYKRSSSYTLQPSDVAISDNFLTSGWYRFDSGAGNDVVRSAPSLSQCGTIYPIWMQGTLPSDADGEVTRTACIVGLIGQCGSSLSIKVKSCGGHRVYYLVPPSQTSTGYCIGEGSPCPAGQSSSNGFTPCQASTPVNTDPKVNVSLENGNLFPNAPTFRPVEAVFQCQHPEPSGGPYWYDTYWYINNDEVKVVENRPYQDNQSWLYPRDWVHKYNMNMVVKCSVRVRQSDGGTPGHHNYSQDFQAGMFPAFSTYTVKEGETISIEFTVTVPMGCFDINRQQLCKNRIYVLTPEYQSAVGSCQNYTGQGGVSFEENECGILIESSTWWHKKILNVTGKTDGFINARDRDTNIRLGAQTVSAEDPSGVWFNFTMPDIKIHLYDVDKNIANKLCYARTDPRMDTFDEKYWTALLAGEFIMYRDVRNKIAVHALFSSCTWQGWLGQGPCGCGIAVRVEDSLFVHRTCQEISYRYATPLIHHDTVYHICDNRHMVVDIGNPWTKITLPTGAIVEYRVGRSWLYNIHITPSIFDENNVDGLCGNPNNDKTDDFTSRGSSSSTTDKNVFQSSWRVDINSSESLFGPNPALNNSDFELKKYCECATEMSSYLDPLSNHYTANCSIAEKSVVCSEDSTSESFTSTCDRHENRYKRESNPDSDDVTETQILTVDPQFDFNFTPPTPTWKNGWTESAARTHCENAIFGNQAVVECQKYIAMENKTNGAVDDCILDIRDAGTTEFVSYTVESLNRFCFEQIKKYEVFYTTNGTQSESVIDIIGKMVCPENCSANGVCSAGVCICSSSFVGADCSHAKTSPPVNTTLPENGLCKSNIRACAKTNIYGYFQSDVVHVKFVLFEITSSGKSSPISTHITEATYVSSTIIKADFPTSSRRKRSASLFGSGFDISLSYDGTNFGDTMPLIIFNDECYICSAVTLECNLTTSCSDSTTSETSTDAGPITTMPSGGQSSQHPVGGVTQPRTTPIPNVYIEEDVPLGLMVVPCVLLVLILIIVSMLLFMKLRPNPRPSSSFPGSDTVECGQPPVQHGRPLSPPPQYDSINPKPHTEEAHSEKRPHTPSAITMAFPTMPNMPAESG